jgi:uncharacterized protein YdaU (DUF1376 family)
MAEPDHITTPGKSPAFQFYPSDFISGTIDLSAEEVGAYMRFICYQWEKGSIPDDLDSRSRIAGLSRSRMARVWERVKRHYVHIPIGFINKRLERVRQDQIAFRERQAANGRNGGRPPKPKNNPGLSSGLSQTEPTRNPNESSSIFCLQSSNKKEASGDVHDEIAADFLEQYPTLYARVRNGARYAVSRMNMERDLGYARDLVRGWPDIKRLLEMAEVFLRMDIGDKNRPGTIGQFLHMAPDADNQLRKNGR